MISKESAIQKWLPWLFIALAAILFIAQLRSLSVSPEPNSFRWYGDETWLMTEAEQQIATGKVDYPLAIGSQLEHGKGLVLGVTWLSAILYGLPVWLSGMDPVSVGRCITATLALCLLLALFVTSRTIGANRVSSALAVLFLVTTRAFFFASHSTRPDLLAGLIVLLIVVILFRISQTITTRSKSWWFAFGALVTFLALSSSIHLVTLLGPVSAYIIWKKIMGAQRQRSLPVFMIVAGVFSMIGILAIIYYVGNGSLQLFPASAARGQFHDVLHAIPIFRPFSRSVQVANMLIRFKQLIAEAPVIFMLPLLVPFVWRRANSKHTLAIAVVVVTVSWFLLEGAEVNYLTHVLPLLFLCLAIVTSKIIARWKFTEYVFTILAAVTFVFGLRDANVAFASGSAINSSNKSATQMVEDSIGASWDSKEKPLVLVEPPLLESLSQDTALRVMTDHFISFPEHDMSLDSFLVRENINYAVLYNSQTYPKIRPKDDPFYKTIFNNGTLIAKYIGTCGDAGRDYFNHSTWLDTILLFKFSNKQ